MDAGQRDRLISFEAAGTSTTNDYGEVIESTSAVLATAWARVRFGTGQERREAAQEAASIAATFECLWSPTLATVPTTARIVFDGANWDIVSKALVGLNKELHFTAVRKS
jgi:head-tail adaptor